MPPNDALDRLYDSPDFLIRRAHQAASAAFAEACADLDLTPAQYATLFALRHRAPIGQNELGRVIALDRATMSMVVRLLRERDLVSAADDPNDKRRSLLSLTRAGRLLLARAEKASGRASEELLAVLSPEQAATLMELLGLLTSVQRPGPSPAPQ
ncbi:MAG: winged helix-turn-helix transcriptional regulator [Comamonadaceae bacterium]|jgi:DNA-binding MarR family transcriptional regulator|nr:winged helix-turn-helix transcriptional regulator [Comamonadaceae bacterium]